jgi:hypothetical protein
MKEIVDEKEDTSIPELPKGSLERRQQKIREEKEKLMKSDKFRAKTIVA